MKFNHSIISFPWFCIFVAAMITIMLAGASFRGNSDWFVVYEALHLGELKNFIMRLQYNDAAKI